VVGDGGVGGGELPQTSHPPEPKHRPLPSSERKVRVLRPVVQPPAGFLPVRCTDLFQGRAVLAKLVRHVALAPTVPLHSFPEEFNAALLSRVLVTKLSSTSPS
jgi:hypothetical protein